jgi:hypothetical protein
VLLGLMRQFPAYTLAGARAESCELLRLLEIERLGTPEGGDDG